MKHILSISFLFTILSFYSCDKMSFDKDNKEICDFVFNLDDLQVGSWDKAAELDLSETKEYEVERLVYSEDCDCIVAGFMKYVEHGKTKFLIQYGEGACDSWATKTTCFNGDCCNEESFTEKFEISNCSEFSKVGE